MTSFPEEDLVQGILVQHGLSASQDELHVLTAAFRANRQQIKSIYTLQGVRYEEPALTFNTVQTND